MKNIFPSLTYSLFPPSILTLIYSHIHDLYIYTSHSLLPSSHSQHHPSSLLPSSHSCIVTYIPHTSLSFTPSLFPSYSHVVTHLTLSPLSHTPTYLDMSLEVVIGWEAMYQLQHQLPQLLSTTVSYELRLTYNTHTLTTCCIYIL